MILMKFSQRFCIFMKIEVHLAKFSSRINFFFGICKKNYFVSLFLSSCRYYPPIFAFFFFLAFVFSPVAAREFFFLFFFLFVLTMYCISRFDSGVFCLSVQISGDGGCTVVFCNFHSLRLRVLALWGQIWVMIP